MSLDIDGNDYWVMEKLKIKADLIICEFNGIFGDIHEITIPYKKNFDRSKEHYSNLYYGCSIRSLISLFLKKKYHFIGTNSAGNNAYFLNKENFDLIKNRIRKIKIFSPKFRNLEILNLKKPFYPNIRALN